MTAGLHGLPRRYAPRNDGIFRNDGSFRDDGSFRNDGSFCNDGSFRDDGFGGPRIPLCARPGRGGKGA